MNVLEHNHGRKEEDHDASLAFTAHRAFPVCFSEQISLGPVMVRSTCLSGAGWPGCRVRPWRRANINSHLHRRKNVDPAGGMRVALCHDDLAEEPRRACFATSLSKQEFNTLSFAAGPRKLRYNYKLQPPCLLVRYKLHRPGMHGLHDRASINKRGTCQSKDNRARQRCNMRWAA